MRAHVLAHRHVARLIVCVYIGTEQIVLMHSEQKG